MTASLPLASAAALGFSAKRLARIDRFLAERYVEPGLLPGALLLVARRGELVHRTVLGHASIERKQTLEEEDTIFRIYSMTKPVTSVAFMMLAEEGRISLDDPVAKWLPSWRDQAVFVGGLPGAFTTRPAAAPMRVVDLLRHTSGLTYGFHNRTNLDAVYRALKIDVFAQESLAGFCEALGPDASGVLARHLLELQRLDRRRRPSGQPRLGPALRRVREAPHPAAARHARHRLPRARGQGGALRRVLCAVARRCARACPARQLPRTAACAFGRWRPGRHRSRLSALLRDAASRRRARRRAPARPEDARAHAHEPPARRPRARRPRSTPACSRKPPTRGSASVSASRW